ncbi:MAG: glycosyltransferase [Verrucomicrobiae bacterium]|nr:glycosyltransferase [Verrucomicrobiae bacterium]
MLRNRLYYLLKPYLPWRTRMMLRRWSAQRILRRSADVWPVLDASARVPAHWPGWPDGHDFALVLTHDVEDIGGLHQVRQLAEAEHALGFRSSFNLIPDGPYSVPPELRAWLVEQGFEVGIHDLHHDGHLYSSRQGFRERAQRINQFLASWNAVGFRSGFMHHNLDWLHDLNILYDASTFDTDPLEPQPDGAGTIFPFWAPQRHSPARPDGQPPSASRRYVELPYTLPQDSTLFLLLQHRDPSIWMRKLDWLVERGGMALINVHPDYLDFSGSGRNARQFPASHYLDFLKYVRTRYAGRYWQPLPKDLAAWYRDTCPAPSPVPAPAPSIPEISTPDARPEEDPVGQRACLAGRRAAVILYSYYPSDPRPRRAAEALVEAGMQVDLFCLSEGPHEPAVETVHGVQVFRSQLKRRRDSKLTYFVQYAAFLLASALFLSRRSLAARYHLVHVHNMPDVLVFSALVPKLLGAKVVLDFHDPMPELMTAIYNLSDRHPLVRLLRRLERWSIAFSDLSVTPNIAFRNLFLSRGCPPDKMRIVMNSPEESIFDPSRASQRPPPKPGSPPAFRLMHHGSIVHRHGIDTLVRAVAIARHHIPGLRLDIFGSRTPFLDTVLALTRELDLESCVAYHGPKPQTDIALAILEADLGIVPNRRSPFTELNFPTRLFEYLSLGRPVIAPNTHGIRDYFPENAMCYFEPGDAEDLARQILWIHQHPDEIQARVQRGRDIYQAHLWSQERRRWIHMVHNLFHSAQHRPSLAPEPFSAAPLP